MWAASTIVALCNFALEQAQLPDDPRELARLCETVVQRWEKAMSDLESFEVRFDRTEDDGIFKSKTLCRGTVKYLKGKAHGDANRWSFVCEQVADPKQAIEIKVSESKVFVISRNEKQVLVTERQRKVPFLGQVFVQADKAIDFALGNTEEIRRFDIQLLKSDENYFYLELRPKRSSNTSVRLAQVALNRNTYIPRTIRILQANSIEMRWDFPVVKTAVQLRPSDFEAVPAPDGWTVIELPELGVRPTSR